MALGSPPGALRHDSARDGGGRDRVGELPVVALAREAGPGAERVDRGARRVVESRRRRQPPGADRRRALHAVGRCARDGRDRARRLLPAPLQGGVRAGFRSLDRDETAPQSTSATLPLRDARVRARVDEGGRAARERGHRRVTRGEDRHPAGGQLRPRRGALRRVLFFAGISTKLHARSSRIAILGFGYAIFLGTAIWIATFPVSVSL